VNVAGRRASTSTAADRRNARDFALCRQSGRIGRVVTVDGEEKFVEDVVSS